MDEKKIIQTEKTYRNGKKVLIIHYDDGTRKVVPTDPLYR